MARVHIALGLMSGTSLDGVDAALLRTDGVTVADLGPWLSLPYDDELRAKLRLALTGEGDIAEVERELTVAHAEVIQELAIANALQLGDVDVIGFHGQTIHHDPAVGETRQIGNGALLAQLTGVDVVNEFRIADVAAGGQGAPLAPIYHEALAQGLEHPLAVLNVGGVANVTWIGRNRELIAFDTGPGNALVDDWVHQHTGRAMDEDGALAAAGTVHEDFVEAMMDSPYFALPPPKSLDRNDFTTIAVRGLGLEAGAATLTEFTARAVALGLRHLPEPPKLWLVAGGGRLNPIMMAALRRLLGAPVEPVERVGWRGDALEAEAFAFLAVRSLLGLPISLPTTTGVPHPMQGGRLHRRPTAAAV